MFVRVAFYDPDPQDPTSGPVINTLIGDSQFVSPDATTVPIPEDVNIEDVRKWAVQKGKLVMVSYQVESYEVNEERNRRITTGKEFDISQFGYNTPVWLTGDREGQINLMGLAFGAVLRALMADPAFAARLATDPTIQPFRDGMNDVHDLNSLQLAMTWAEGAKFVSDIIKASWPLKEAVVMDDDLKNDSNWQTSV